MSRRHFHDVEFVGRLSCDIFVKNGHPRSQGLFPTPQGPGNEDAFVSLFAKALVSSVIARTKNGRTYLPFLKPLNFTGTLPVDLEVLCPTF